MGDKKVAAYTLGCKVNQYETEAILELFKRQGYQLVAFEDVADVYLINTCTVTHMADRKSRQMIRRAIRKNPGARIIVTGCYAQGSAEEILDIPGVDIVIGNQDRIKIIEWLNRLEKEKSFQCPVLMVKDIRKVKAFEELPLPLERGRTRALVKVEDGCNQFCSYCIIPYTRGPVRSRQPQKIVEEISHLVSNGYKEIVLTGIHLSAYGQEWQKGKAASNLATLIEFILKEVPYIPRLRIGSVEPDRVLEGLGDIIAGSKILCRHLHIPLQNGDDEILNKMRRPYSTAQYRTLIDKLRSQIPGIAITSDIMVGFPGETKEHFDRSFNFIRELEFSDLHVFKYSPRKGTLAASFQGQIPADVKNIRSQKLLSLAQECRKRYANKWVNQTLEVLLEEKVALKENDRDTKDYLAGYSDNYLRIVVSAGEEMLGQFVDVHLKSSKSDFSIGEINRIGRN